MGNAGKKKKVATPLHDAAGKGDLEEVKRLLKGKKIKPNRLNVEQKTALQGAAKGGHLEIVRALLKAGANPDIPDHKGRTALQESAKRGHTEVVALLLKKKAKADRLDSKDSSALHEACKKGHPEIIRALIEKGADGLINQQNYKGISPLHEAARKGQAEVATLLLELGADPQAKDIHGNRPAVLANTFGYSELAEQLGGLDYDEEGEALKIAWLEEVKESAKEIVRQATIAEGRELPLKAELKGASLAAVDVFLAHIKTADFSPEEINEISDQAARDFLVTFKEERDAKGNMLTPEELAAKRLKAEAAAEMAAEQESLSEKGAVAA
ncbi:MAG: ankyrin repeat domain-containing protein [Pseudomonadota bacterium]